MSNDADDFLNRINQGSQNWTGEGREPEAAVKDFHLYGHVKRAEALDQIDEAIRGIDEVGRGEGQIRNYARLMRLRRELGKTHQDLIRVRR